MCYFLGRVAIGWSVTMKCLHSSLQQPRGCCCLFWKSIILSRWFLINANVKLHLYIAESKSCPSLYCANVDITAQLTITVVPYGTDYPFPQADLDTRLIHGSFGPPESSSQRHLDRFSRFCWAHETDQMTDWPTDHATHQAATANCDCDAV